MKLNLNPTMAQAMAMDLGGVFALEISVRVLIEGATAMLTALLNDQVFSEEEDMGGQQLIDLVEVHFQVVDMPSIANETVMTVFFIDPQTCLPTDTVGKKKIVLTSKLSNDGNELIVTARAA
jgi:hypothetical protein